MEASVSHMTNADLQTRDLRTVFTLFDTTGRNYINVDDLPVVLRSLGIGKEYLSDDVYESMRSALDPKRTGQISYDSYVNIVGPCMPRHGSFEEQFRVFRMLDRNKKGCLDLEDIAAVGNRECLGMLSEKQCAFIVAQLRTTTRPGITFDEFKRAIGNVMQLEGTA